jgi:hypothetical protein
MTTDNTSAHHQALLEAFNRKSEQLEDPSIPLRDREVILVDLDKIGAELEALGHDWVIEAVALLREQFNLDQLENSPLDPERSLHNPALYRFVEWPVTLDGNLVEFDDL